MIVIDTESVIRLIGGKSQDEEWNRKSLRVRKFANAAEREGSKLAISSLTLAELLLKYTPEKRAAILGQLKDSFIFLPFDLPAALAAADLAHAREEELRAARQTVSRQTFKIDLAIIATAIAQNSEAVLSDDRHFTSIAGGRIKVIITEDLPAAQPDMFED